MTIFFFLKNISALVKSGKRNDTGDLSNIVDYIRTKSRVFINSSLAFTIISSVDEYTYYGFSLTRRWASRMTLFQSHSQPSWMASSSPFFSTLSPDRPIRYTNVRRRLSLSREAILSILTRARDSRSINDRYRNETMIFSVIPFTAYYMQFYSYFLHNRRLGRARSARMYRKVILHDGRHEKDRPMILIVMETTKINASLFI